MKYSFRPLVVASTLCALAFVAGSCYGVSTGFEVGPGHDGGAIVSSMPGFYFGTMNGLEMKYVDITTGNYNVSSDNGLSYETGEYFVKGNIAATTSDLGDQGYCDFSSNPVDSFSLWYSSRYEFFLDAYDMDGFLLESISGCANTRSKGGTGMLQLAVSAPDIAYVVMHDHGGYWLVDDLSTDPVPEPTSAAGLVGGLVGILGICIRRRTNSK